MATLPPSSSINLEGIISDGEVQPEKLVYALNQFIGSAYNALNGQLSVANLKAEWIETKAVVPTSADLVFAEYKTTAAQSFASAAFDVVNYATAVVASAAVTTGAAWKFTAPRAMDVEVSAGACWTNTIPDGTSLTAAFFLNGADSRRVHNATTSTADFVGCYGATTYRLAAADYVDFRMVQASGAAKVLNGYGPDNYITVRELSSSTIAPAACFPLDIALNKLKAPPKAVLLAGVWQSPDPATTTIIAPSQPQWTFTTKNGQPHIRIRNISGLPGGKSYRLRFLVVGE